MAEIDSEATSMTQIAAAALQNSNGSSAIFCSGPVMSGCCSSSSIPIKTALNDCSAAWIAYLNVLNNLCTAGSKLANTITVLEQYGISIEKSARSFPEKATFHNHPTYNLANSWNDLARATAVATSTVKSHVMAVLQDFVTLTTTEQLSAACEMEQKRIRDHNELIILENAQTMINVQHQFCVASYDAFSTLTCCLACHSPVGFPHDQDCIMIHQKCNVDQRSQTPSPHFGYSCKNELPRGNIHDYRPSTVGSISEQMSSGAEPRESSPQQNLRDAIPLTAIFENTRGPLPNPGHLLTMKTPFYRCVKSPLNFPLFPLNVQRRWSEAAAGDVGDDTSIDVESQMRRWSMPWEASKTDKNTVTWYQTRIMPTNTFRIPKMYGQERSNSNTPESNRQCSSTSQDGLIEAIKLLSCKPSRIYHQNPHQCDTINVD